MTPSVSPAIGAQASLGRPEEDMPTTCDPVTPGTSLSVINHCNNNNKDIEHLQNGSYDQATFQLYDQPNPFSEEDTAAPKKTVSKQIQDYVDSVEAISREQIQHWQKEEAKAIKTRKYAALFNYLPEYLFAKAPGMPKHKDEDQMRNVPSILDQEVSRAKSQAELFTYLSHIPNSDKQLEFMSLYSYIHNTGNQLSTALMKKRRDQQRDSEFNQHVWDKEKTKKDPNTGEEVVVHKQGDKKNLDHAQNPLPKGKLAASQAQEIRELEQKVASLTAKLDSKNKIMRSLSTSLEAKARDDS